MSYVGNGWDKTGKNGNFIVVRVEREALQEVEVDENGKITLFIFPKGELSHENVEKEEDWHGDYSVAIPEEDGGTKKSGGDKKSGGYKKDSKSDESSERTKPKKFSNNKTDKKSAFGKNRK